MAKKQKGPQEEPVEIQTNELEQPAEPQGIGNRGQVTKNIPKSWQGDWDIQPRGDW